METYPGGCSDTESMRELDGADVESKDVTSPPTDRERVLSAGVNFTNRPPELKYARAVHLANELRGRIDEWSASETLLARLHQIDDHTIQFRLEVRSRPPIDEWSLILGDALHNLRSVFDTAIWLSQHSMVRSRSHQPRSCSLSQRTKVSGGEANQDARVSPFSLSRANKAAAALGRRRPTR